MIDRVARSVLVAVVAVLAGCGATVTPAAPHDGGGDDAADVPADAAVCRLPSGGTCPVGATCPAGDGCNECTCPAGSGGGAASCTLRACPMPDAGVTCRTRADCARGYCRFPTDRCVMTGVCDLETPCFRPETWCACDGTTYMSCEPNRPTQRTGPCEPADAGPGPGVCRADTDCASGFEQCVFPEAACGAAGRCQGISDCALIVAYCACDGTTFRACPNRPTRPNVGRGECGADAGVADGGAACAGARIAGTGHTCVAPDGGALPLACCTGWNCDTRTAACRSLPPACPAGEVNTVADACWGPCVPPASCAPLACGADGDCPPGWGCAGGRCGRPR